LDRPAPETAALLWEQFEREPDDRCRASLLIGFGYVASPTPANQSLLLATLLKRRSRPEQLAAALALARIFPAELTREAAEEILHALHDSSTATLMDNSPWGVHGMELIIEGVLLGLEGSGAAYVIGELEKALADGGHPFALNAARVLLALAFRDPLHKDATLEALSVFQQRIIQLMAINKHAWVKSVAGDPARAPQDAVVFRLRSTDFAMERLCGEAALAAGTFTKQPTTLRGRLQWWISKP
jgi:hypothetical protein